MFCVLQTLQRAPFAMHGGFGLPVTLLEMLPGLC